MKLSPLPKALGLLLLLVFTSACQKTAEVDTFASPNMLTAQGESEPSNTHNLNYRYIKNDVADAAKTPKGTVVLLHGLWRDWRAMAGLERHLQSEGYTTINISYPSTEYDIPTLVSEYVAPVLEQFPRHSATQTSSALHFVTHSMGGILVRHLLQEYEVANLGRVVMLAPPNSGSEIVDSTMNLPFSSPSPATVQLSTAANSFVNQLGPANYELGIIAGNANNNIITNALIDGENDGVVSVKSTYMENMQDCIVVPLKHYRLRGDAKVKMQVSHFLNKGVFDKQLVSVSSCGAEKTAILTRR
ncbi:esterase/lipase family protein [Ningiella sp. W23]|uniref:esterase/lipase family protein n=1 Tax=Ningiella sp. W23 TaxID=3023715 RepID=UPI003757E22C